jgi:hypothetical protein
MRALLHDTQNAILGDALEHFKIAIERCEDAEKNLKAVYREGVVTEEVNRALSAVADAINFGHMALGQAGATQTIIKDLIGEA